MRHAGFPLFTLWLALPAPALATCMPAGDACTVTLLDDACTPVGGAAPVEIEAGGTLRGTWMCPESICCAGERCSTAYRDADLHVRAVDDELALSTGRDFTATGQVCTVPDPDGSWDPEGSLRAAPTMDLAVVALDTTGLQPGTYEVEALSFTVTGDAAPPLATDWPPGFVALFDGVHGRRETPSGEVTVPLVWTTSTTTPLELLLARLEPAGWRLTASERAAAWGQRDDVLVWIRGGSPDGPGYTITWETTDLPPPSWWEAEAPCPEGTTLQGPAQEPFLDGWTILADVYACARDDGTRHGSWTVRAEGGYLRTGTWAEGRREGDYFEDQVSSTTRGHFTADRRDGVWVVRDWSGAVSTRGGYRQGEKHGEWTTYASGHVDESSSFCDGLQCGDWARFHPDGTLAEAGHFSAGQKDGAFVAYYDDGTLELATHFAQGVEDGPYRRYFGNGQLWWQGASAQGQRQGTWKTWDRDGRLQSVEDYEAGVVVGTSRHRVCRQDGWREVCTWEKRRH